MLCNERHTCRIFGYVLCALLVFYVPSKPKAQEFNPSTQTFILSLKPAETLQFIKEYRTFYNRSLRCQNIDTCHKGADTYLNIYPKESLHQIDLQEALYPFINFSKLSRRPKYQGFNCLNAAMMFQSYVPYQSYVDPIEFKLFLNQYCQRVDQEEDIQFGDVGVNHANSQRIHAFTYLFNHFVFEKPNTNEISSYRINRREISNSDIYRCAPKPLYASPDHCGLSELIGSIESFDREMEALTQTGFQSKKGELSAIEARANRLYDTIDQLDRRDDKACDLKIQLLAKRLYSLNQTLNEYTKAGSPEAGRVFNRVQEVFSQMRH